MVPLTVDQMKEGFAAVREHFMNLDGPEEIICSQEFFDSLSTKEGPTIHGIAQLPVRVDAALAAKTAIVRYRSGKMVYLTPDGPRRTPEEETAAMEKFMAAESPMNIFDPFGQNRVETIFDFERDESIKFPLRWR